MFIVVNDKSNYCMCIAQLSKRWLSNSRKAISRHLTTNKIFFSILWIILSSISLFVVDMRVQSWKCGLLVCYFTLYSSVRTLFVV